jgi:hypothetical protein
MQREHCCAIGAVGLMQRHVPVLTWEGSIMKTDFIDVHPAGTEYACSWVHNVG